ncbi:MAG: hypothetical protein M1829_004688 [Trizodia sp. TS-e1964]|nr:MAG: hypothetical protein M1829_004688 [Trizodia sp. TS-e1964]
MKAPTPSSFQRKKETILRHLALPEDQYTDHSPKGSVDEGIRALLAEINTCPGLVTTSSCAGRISVFLEGQKRCPDTDAEFKYSIDDSGRRAGAPEGKEEKKLAGLGGKGNGGRWLFVSHTPLALPSTGSNPLTALFGLTPAPPAAASELLPPPLNSRYVHFKFEPMILHIQAASHADAQRVLGAAMQAGFRESGALNLVGAGVEGAAPIVAVRSAGLGFDSVVGVLRGGGQGEVCSVVDEAYLRMVVGMANERFEENERRKGKFRQLLRAGAEETEGWEDRGVRSARMRGEGLARREELRNWSARVREEGGGGGE